MISRDKEDGQIQKSLSKALEYYEKSIIPRASVMAIPYIGGSIDRLLSGKAALKWQEKVMKLLKELNLRLQGIEENKIDKDFLENEEFEGLIIQVFQALQFTHEQEKIGYFADILSRVVTLPLSRDERKERYVSLVEELTGIHIRIIKLFAKRKTFCGKNYTDNDVVITAAEISKQLGLRQVEIEAFCSDLLSRGLLYDPHLGKYGYKPGSYALHPSAYSFIEVLNLAT